LEAALGDIAVDLDAINVNGAPNDEDWRRYLAGDRTVFARRIADVIDEAAISRISTLNRESTRFREAANSYMEEFESLLERARQGDNGGLLASTMLSADTGKIYLAIAYALGRLSS
jgi:cytochrome P450